MEELTMKKVLLLASVAMIFASEAHAAVLTLKLKNASALALTAITSKSRNGAAATTALSGTVAAGGNGSLQITQIGTDCVYDMTLTFGATKTVALTNIDICQTDAMTVE
jgi:opacity protein-like surface antigen